MMKYTLKPIRAALFLALLAWFCFFSCKPKVTPKILIFSKTAGYRHESIETGIEALIKLGKEHHIDVDTTENAELFNEENLRNYQAVIFLNTTGDVLNKQQQNDFERFIQAGGGFVGIHAASDTEYHWPWYNNLVGAYFDSHPNNPNVRKGEFYLLDKKHPSTAELPERFTREDEFYNFTSIKEDLIRVLIAIDETSYEGGKNGKDHPMSWYHEYDGGRSFYTAMGHTKETYKDSLFLTHLWGGLQYALGDQELNYKKAKTVRVPDENRFTKIVLDEKLDEPVELAVLPDEKVLFIERKGAIKLYDPELNQTRLIYRLDVSHKYKYKDSGRDEAEDGLLGLTLDPNFSKNHWIYLYYSPAGEKEVNILTRWDFVDGTLVENSKKVILEVPVQREQCCHTGGSITFDSKGNLYLSTGDNTSPRSTRYAPIDERPGRSPWDAQKGPANTNDLRGKILRIHPEADGTYTIPSGNLFSKGTPKTRPEIYGMGMRNPYRISVDKKTGYVYWGDVGPDARENDSIRGPMGYDEINQLKEPGFFGWPYFGGNNQAYYDYDFALNKQGEKFDPKNPVNSSPNNTGLSKLPPAQPAFIWYPYDLSTEFPFLGSGGRTAMAGPVFYSDEFKKAKRPFPDYYNGKLFIYEWMRGWIMAVTMDQEGNLVEIEHFMPSYKFSNPMDMEFGPNGDLYMLEYGTGWFQQNDNARLVRIAYNAGNRPPKVELKASKTKGALPMKVDFSSEGTLDYDRDKINFEWSIQEKGGKTISTAQSPSLSYTFDKAGTYEISLTVKDSEGGKNSKKIQIQAGNAPAEISFEITQGNTMFYFSGVPIHYQVDVVDYEDGSLTHGQIDPEEVAVTANYLKEGFDRIEVAQGHLAADELIGYSKGKILLEENDCKICHKLSEKSIGPTYLDVAKKYPDNPKTGDYLIKKIINGGSGVWGETAMSAHPTLSIEDAGQMVKYILSLADEKSPIKLPVKGSYTVPLEEATKSGTVILRAAYQDKGSKTIPPIKSEEVLILRSPSIPPDMTFKEKDINKFKPPGSPNAIVIGVSGSYTAYKAIDLTGVNSIDFTVSAYAMYGQSGGSIEVRVGSPSGEVLGTSAFIKSTQEGPPKGRQEVSVPIDKSGIHDVFLIWRSMPEVSGSLFIISEIILKQ